MSIRSLAAILLLVLAASGCSRPYLEPDVKPSNATFMGVRQALAFAPAVDVVYTHGMCTHDRGDITTKISSLLDAVGIAHGSPDEALPKIPIKLPHGALLYEKSFKTPGSTLRIHAIVWSPITNQFKKRLCYDQTKKGSYCTDESPSPPTRALLNAWAKSGLLDDCLSDAIIAIGGAKPLLYDAFQEGLLHALSGGNRSTDTKELAKRASNQDAPLFFVSESLGSKILFDTLNQMAQDKANALGAKVVERTLGRTYEVYMAANQLALLDLLDEQAPGPKSVRAPQGSLKNLADIYRKVSPVPPPSLVPGRKRAVTAIPRPERLQLVAFSDPNDLLSYGIDPSDSIIAAADVDVVNVVVSNRRTYFWLFENPSSGHRTYLENDAVTHLIACGKPLADVCARKN